MGILLELLFFVLTHPHEFCILLHFWNHQPRRDITRKEEHATSGWDKATMRRCWELLDLTSHSFATAIRQLDGDLARVVCLFSQFRVTVTHTPSDLSILSCAPRP